MTTLDGGRIIKKGGGATPPSGGESGGSNYEYFALTDGWFEDLGISFTYLCSLVKATTSGAGVVVAPVKFAEMLNGNNNVEPIAVAIDMSLMIGVAGQQATIKDSILDSVTTEESLAKYRITKEEFYNLD